MRLKKNKDNKNDKIFARCTVSEKNRIQQKANIYADGNLSEYIIYTALNFIPGKEDLDEDKKKKPTRKR